MKLRVVSLLALVLMLGAWGARAANEGPQGVPAAPASPEATLSAVNFDTPEQAEAFAKELIADYVAEYGEAAPGKSTPQLVLVHLGKEIPAPLEWVMLHLNAARIPHRVEVVTAEALETALQEGQEKAERMILMNSVGGNSVEPGMERVRGLSERSRFFLKQLFGLPNGMTLWFWDIPQLGLKKPRLIRSEDERKKEFKAATVQGTLAGASLLATFYVKDHAFISHGIAGIPVFMAWVWTWSYYARSLSLVMSQGKAVKEVAPHEWKTKNSDLYFYTGSYLRGLITNSIVMACLTQGDLLHWHSAGMIATNALVNLFARSWIDKWIVDKQATTYPDGRVEVRAGEHTPKQTIFIRLGWEFSYGLLKNLQLLGMSSILDGVYLTMGAVGISKKLYEERFGLARQADAIRNKITGQAEADSEPVLPGSLAALRICELAFE